MVSESELIGRLREYLRDADLNTTTTATLRRQLEKDFGIDLSDKKVFIRDQVDLFLQSQHERAEEDGDQEFEEEEDQKFKVKTESSDGSGSKDEEEEDDDDDGEEVEHARNGKIKRGSNKHGNEVKKRGGGFNKVCSLSPQLQEFMRVPEMARTEVVKKIWAYIREKNLQDSNNRQNIICDEALQVLFGVDSINMFQMNKALSKHIWPLDSDGGVQVKVKPTPKEKQKRQQREEDSDEPKQKEKRQKGGKSGFLAPLQLSDALVSFLGTGESELSRSEVIKRMWDYIKQNDLQDPSDKRRIICDEKLKELFDVDSFHGFTVSKLLASHFIKTEQ